MIHVMSCPVMYTDGVNVVGLNTTPVTYMVPPASGMHQHQHQYQDQSQHQHQLQRQRQRQRQRQPSRRELRWNLPGDAISATSSRGPGRTRRAGEDAVDPGPDQHAPAATSLGAGVHSATTWRRSSLRRATSSSPPPPVSSQRPLDGLRRRYSSQSTEMGVSGGGGVGGRRRHSSSLGPTVRFRRGRSEVATAAAGGHSSWSSRESQWGGRWRQPRQLCVAVVVRQMAQRAVEDLLSVG